MYTYKIKNIQKVNYNGKQVKLFEVWKNYGDRVVFFCKSTAPARIANKNLESFFRNEF